ncbi:MAG: hypothetical protein NVS9B9_21740 [Ktedonobacteraceae bacterium]
MPTFSKEAMERPYRTIQAAGVLRENAETIGLAAAGAREDELVIAAVHEDLSFAGAWAIARENLAQQVLETEDNGGWSLIFSPNISDHQIEERCNELTRIAHKRWEAMQRWASRHPENDDE